MADIALLESPKLISRKIWGILNYEISTLWYWIDKLPLFNKVGNTDIIPKIFVLGQGPTLAFILYAIDWFSIVVGLFLQIPSTPIYLLGVNVRPITWLDCGGFWFGTLPEELFMAGKQRALFIPLGCRSWQWYFLWISRSSYTTAAEYNKVRSFHGLHGQKRVNFEWVQRW